MNLLILSSPDNQAAFYATATPDALRAEIGRHRDIDAHYTIPCPKAPSVIKCIGRHQVGKLTGMAPPWYVMSMSEAIDIAARALQKCGADSLVVRGGIQLRAPARGNA